MIGPETVILCMTPSDLRSLHTSDYFFSSSTNFLPEFVPNQSRSDQKVGKFKKYGVRLANLELIWS